MALVKPRKSAGISTNVTWQELAIAEAIMKWWKTLFRSLPQGYLSFDCETSGFDPNDDLIVEFGYCYVEDCKPVKQLSWVLDWTQSPEVDVAWLEYKLENCRKQMAQERLPYHMTIDRMRKIGRPPLEALANCVARIKKIRREGKFLVGHGLVGFDCTRLAQATQEWLGQRFELPPECLLDTGAIEKAVGLGMAPLPGEKSHEFFKRAANARGPRGYKWNLGLCVEKYELDKKFGIRMDQLHGAKADAFATHCLLEEFRKLA